jgi:hypothetical protein
VHFERDPSAACRLPEKSLLNPGEAPTVPKD